MVGVSKYKSSFCHEYARGVLFIGRLCRSVGLVPSALDIPALGTIVPEKSGRARARSASQA